MGMFQFKSPENPGCSRGQFRRILKSDQSGRIFLLPHGRRQHHGVRQVSQLSDLTVGESAIMVTLDLPENVQNHLMHMGFVPDSLVTALRRAPAGDPTVYGIDGLEIALRHETASAICVRPVEPAQSEAAQLDPSQDSAPELAEAAR